MSRLRLPLLLLVAAIVFLAVSWVVILRRGTGLEGPRVTLDLGDGVTMDLVRIPAGSFMMGSDDDWEQERPVHQVTISRDFYIGTHEVTQEQWLAVMGTNPSGHSGGNLPVEMISWEDAVAFTEALSDRLGCEVRLPTEAEWEYACRAGTTTKYCFGDDAAGLGDYGWSVSNSDRLTQPVGGKRANAWGLFDMHGNVWEWCTDWHDKGYYSQSPSTDPAGPSSGESRVLRGGGYLLRDTSVRSAVRGNHSPELRFEDLGLRIVVEVS
jgi:formylglycine-generating enzyme required for sulfatase activity